MIGIVATKLIEAIRQLQDLSGGSEELEYGILVLNRSKLSNKAHWLVKPCHYPHDSSTLFILL
jgi:hypothetical protein